jgi:uncharacterized protein YjbI with pentapeptide repeats
MRRSRNGDGGGSGSDLMAKARRLIPISAEWILKRIKEEKKVRLKNAQINGSIDLRKLDLPTKFVVKKDYRNSNLNSPMECKIISSQILISNSEFKEEVRFHDCFFDKDVEFDEAKFCKYVGFDGATFNEHADFSETTFIGYAEFSRATFSSSAFFLRATFSGNAWFDGAAFSGYTELSGAKFEGDVLTFRAATFAFEQSQEAACRKAKNVLEKNGNREEAGYHFYREMEGRRKQKPEYIRYPEWFFIQLIFGYGVHPFRLMACWFGFVFLFAAIYSLGHGIDAAASQLNGNATLTDYVWFSIATAVTPGYAGYKPVTDFKMVAGIEAIFGTFMWAAFIATFARKYMR